MRMVKPGDVVQVWVEDYAHTIAYIKPLHKKLHVVLGVGMTAIHLKRIRPGKLYYEGNSIVVPRAAIRMRKIDIREASDNLAAWMMRQALESSNA